MDLSGIGSSLSEIAAKAQESAGSIASNRSALIGVVLIAAIVVGASFVALNQPNNNNQQVTSKERIVKLEGRDVVIGTGCNCPVDENLVCGSDGKNYLNECFARCLNAEIQTRSPCAGTTGGTSAVGQGSGETAGTICAVGLEVNEGSICGVTEDGFNRCGEGLQCIDGKCADVDGVNCNGQIISPAEYAADPSACGKTGTCGEKFAPVCADNQATFTNACEAQKAGYLLAQLSPGPCQASSCPAANQRCGLTYVSYNGEKQFTWHDSQGCCAGSKCGNGICVGGQSYCPDGKPTTGSLESCYPTSTTIVTSSGSSCPPAPSCTTITQTCPSITIEDEEESGANATTRSSNASLTCSDTDGANGNTLNVWAKGRATGIDSSNASLNGSDYCVGRGVHEFYCTGNSTNIRVVNATVECPTGATCKLGACLTARTASCIDSDRLNISVQGTTNATFTNGNSVERQDSCKNSTVLFEWYCTGTNINSTKRTCPRGQHCARGACVSAQLSGSGATPPPATPPRGVDAAIAGILEEVNAINRTMPGETLSTICTDSDNGTNISIAGTVTTRSGTVVQTLSDTCITAASGVSLYVNESYCYQGTSLRTAPGRCTGDMECRGGACTVVSVYYPERIHNQSSGLLGTFTNLVGPLSYSDGVRLNVSPLNCPRGFIDYNVTCAQGGRSIKGWIAVDLSSDSSAVQGITRIKINASSTGQYSCSSPPCTNGSYHVFTAESLASKAWTHRGICTVLYPQTTECNIVVSASGVAIEGILLGRVNSTSQNVDPEILKVKATS